MRVLTMWGIAYGVVGTVAVILLGTMVSITAALLGVIALTSGGLLLNRSSQRRSGSSGSS